MYLYSILFDDNSKYALINGSVSGYRRIQADLTSVRLYRIILVDLGSRYKIAVNLLFCGFISLRYL